MNAIIDTSSLLALVRYYLPFDQNNKLKNLFQKSFESGEFIIIDRVLSESRFQAKGIVLKELDFINSTSKHILRTDDILPDAKFFNRLENEFCNKDIVKSKDIDDAEFELEKANFLNGADAKIILCAYKMIRQNQPLLMPKHIVIITEETTNSNDGKIFKKIPTISQYLGVDCCTLPVLLKNHYSLNLSEYFH